MIIAYKWIMGKLLKRKESVHETHETYMTNEANGGFRSLAVYWLAKEIYYLNYLFCEKYISRTSRTFEQMIQAARSCKQNLVEGSLENSSESNLKLSGISRASFGELGVG